MSRIPSYSSLQRDLARAVMDLARYQQRGPAVMVSRMRRVIQRIRAAINRFYPTVGRGVSFAPYGSSMRYRSR